MRIPPFAPACSCQTLRPLVSPAHVVRLLLSVVVLAAISSAVSAQEPNKNLPAELAAIPQDAFAFIHLRPADLWQSQPTAMLRKLFPRESAGLLEILDGEDPAETESLTFVYSSPSILGTQFRNFTDDNNDASPDSTSQLLLVETTVKPFQQAKVLERLLGKDAAENKHQKRTFYTTKTRMREFLPGAVHFINDRTYLFTFTPETMKKTLDALDPRAAGPLAAALDMAAQKRQVVLGLNATLPAADKLRRALTEDLGRGFRRGPDPFLAIVPLLEVRTAAVGIDVGKEFRLDAEMTFPDAQHAAKASTAVEDAMILLRLFAGGAIRAEIHRQIQSGVGRETVQSLVFAESVLSQVESALLKSAIQQRQTTLQVTARSPIDLSALHESAGRMAKERVREDFAVFHIRVAEIWRSDIAVKLRQIIPQIEKESPMLAAMGLLPDNVENLSIVMPSSRGFGIAPRRAEKTFRKVQDKMFDDRAFPPQVDPAPVPKFDPKEELLPRDFDKKDKDIKPELKDFDKKPEKFEQFSDVAFRDRRLETVMLQPGRRVEIIEDDFRANDFMVDEALMMTVTTVKPFDRQKIMKQMFRFGKGAVEKKHRNKSYFVEQGGFERTAVCFVDERTFIILKPGEWMPVALDRVAMFQAKGPLGDAVESARKKHQLVVGVNFTEPFALEIKREIVRALQQERFPTELEPFRALEPLIDAQSVFLAGDVGKDVSVQADVMFPSGEVAGSSTMALQDALHLARLYIIPLLRTELRFSVQRTIDDRQDLGPLVFGDSVLVPGDRPVIVPQRDLRPMFFTDGLLARADAILRKVTVEKKGATLSMLAQGRIDVAMIEAEARENAVKLVKSQQTELLVRKSAMNLDRIMEALQAYQDVHGKLPVSGKLSWRVQILPFMDELALYQEFKQDEPWDSPHNIKLLPRMPKIFAPPGIKTNEPFTTHYQAFTGPGTVFDPNLKNKNKFDGKNEFEKNGFLVGRGIAIVEAQDATAWTKPADLVYDAKKPLPKLGGVFQHGFHVVFMNGGVRFVAAAESVNEATLRRWILEGEEFDRRRKF